MKPPKKCCRTCRFWNINVFRTSSGAYRVRKDYAAKCLWKFGYPMPSAMGRLWNPPEPGYTEADEGAECPCYEIREESQTKD